MRAPSMTLAWLSLDEPGIEHLAMCHAESGIQFRGHWSGVLDGIPAHAAYRLDLHPDWTVRRVVARWTSATEQRRLILRRDTSGAWHDARGTRPDLAACTDIDLTWTPLTNTLPIRRLSPPVGGSTAITVAYITAPSLEVTTNHQIYTHLASNRWRFESPAINFTAEITVDDDGLVLDYESLFRRLATWQPNT